MALNCNLHIRCRFQRKMRHCRVFLPSQTSRSALMTFLCKQEMIFSFSFQMGSFRSKTTTTTTTINGIPHIHRRIISFLFCFFLFFFHFCFRFLAVREKRLAVCQSYAHLSYVRVQRASFSVWRRDGACETTIVLYSNEPTNCEFITN